MSTFRFAGVSRQNGEFKVRFANDATRVKVLIKNGHTDIDIIDLQADLTKEAAVAKLIEINFDNGNAEVRAALESALDKRTEQPKAANKEPRKTKEAKKPKKAPAPKAITIEGIRAKAQPIEIPQVAADEKSKAEIQAELDALEDQAY